MISLTSKCTLYSSAFKGECKVTVNGTRLQLDHPHSNLVGTKELISELTHRAYHSAYEQRERMKEMIACVESCRDRLGTYSKEVESEEIREEIYAAIKADNKIISLINENWPWV